MIALYHGGPHGHSASVLITLAEKGLAFAERKLDLGAFEQHGDVFLAVNPSGQVPVLVEDGRTLTEAFFILLYLDERYPDPPLGGADPRARYAVQKWGKYAETHIAPNLAILAWATHGRPPDARAVGGFDRLPPERRALWEQAAAGFGESEIEAARAALDKAALRIAEDLAEGAGWLAGNAWSLADIAVFPHVARFASLGLALPGSVEDWLGRVLSRPAVRQALGPYGIAATPAVMGPERGRWG